MLINVNDKRIVLYISSNLRMGGVSKLRHIEDVN